MKRSTPVTWAELRVAVLIVAGATVALIAVLTLGGRVGIFAPKYTLYTLMPTVSGLQKGAPIRLAGVDVGTVDQVRFIELAERDSLDARLLRAYGDSLGDRSVMLILRVNESVRDKVTRGSRAKIGTVGLLGDKYVDLEVGDPREAQLAEGDIVLNERPIDYEGLIARAAEGVEELVGSLEGSRQIIARVNEGQGTLGRMINDAELYNEWLRLSHEGTQVLYSIQHGEGALPSLLNDRRLYDQLVRTTADLEGLTTEIRQGEGTMGRMIRDPELYRELVRTVRDGQKLVEQMQGGEGTVARMINDPALYERMNRFVVDAQDLLNDIQQNPRKYINLQIF